MRTNSPRWVPPLRTHLRGGLLALVLGLAWLPGAGGAAVPEYELKLALVFKIARFVTWPDEDAPAERFRFCIVGGDPFGDAVDGLEGRTVRERPVEVLHLEIDDARLGACDIAFVDRRAEDRFERLLPRLADAPVLTVSDASGFAAAGGVVGLATRNSRVSIEINLDAQERAGLGISAQLLRMARLVEPGGAR